MLGGGAARSEVLLRREQVYTFTVAIRVVIVLENIAI